MQTVTSKDGTRIAFDRTGQGPALILVGGALEYRALDSETSRLAALPLLSGHFTVFHYDRRRRGDSGDTTPYAVEREIEDVDALIAEAGGSGFLSGISSGAALAFEAALALGGKVKKLAMYEAPYSDDPQARRRWREYRGELDRVVAAGRAGDALGLFMMLVGMPAEQLDEMRNHPMWPVWEAAALSLGYDAAVLGEESSIPIDRARRLAVPTLVMNGGASFPFMRATAAALAAAIPVAEHLTLPDQTHEVAAEALGPVLVDFFER